jgi:hypothetical protein
MAYVELELYTNSFGLQSQNETASGSMRTKKVEYRWFMLH